MKLKTLFKTLLITSAVLFVMAGLAILTYASDYGTPYDQHEYPYSETNYDDPWRNQFHFSPKGGWMNDVNGLWYLDGQYHMTFQHNPHSTNGDGSGMHWGYATSDDMVNWEQQPIALEPLYPSGKDVITGAGQQNGQGAAWSGSVVVDVDNTSGFATGDTPVLVAFFTEMHVGTSIAFSNDAGKTWEYYNGNPVAPVGRTGVNAQNDRDPHVFWYEPTESWVCALFQSGTTFYTSKNLRDWTQASNINWGNECPDIYELPVDGDYNNMKWILQDASGRYLIGNFNGTTFTPESSTISMDVGPSFYAAQSFYRPNFPDERCIQIAWLSTWGNYLNTATFLNQATFPAELKLVTTANGLRLQRWPIDEIANYYLNTRTWENKTINAGENLLSGISSKTFDLEFEVDLSETTADEIIFRFSGYQFNYDITNQSLLNRALTPGTDNILKIRMLLDWGTIEVFGSNAFSYTASVRDLAVNSSSVEMFANGKVKLNSVRFSDMKSIYPKNGKELNRPAITPIVVDDRDSRLVYSSGWTDAGDGKYNANTCRYTTQNAGNYVDLTFKGTEVSLYASKNYDLGYGDVYLDGEFQERIDCYTLPAPGASRQELVHRLYHKTGLANDWHTIRFMSTGERNPESSNRALVFDYFTYVPGDVILDDIDGTSYDAFIYPDGVEIVDGLSPKTIYNGNWSHWSGKYWANGGYISTADNAGDYVEANFIGTAIDWFGIRNRDLGIVEISIDGVVLGEVDLYHSHNMEAPYKLWSKNDLPFGPHTIRVTVTGRRNAAATNDNMGHDYFKAYADSSMMDTFINGLNAPGVTTTGSWSTHSPRTWAFEADINTANNTGDSLTATFNGTSIDWYGFKNRDLGIINVYIDGELDAKVDLYHDDSEARAKLYSKYGLAGNVPHTIKLEVSGERNSAASDDNIGHDYFRASFEDVRNFVISDPLAPVQYSDGWSTINDSRYRNLSAKSSSEQGASIECVFTGNMIDWYGPRDTTLVKADIYIDDEFQATVDCSGDYSIRPLFSAEGLRYGNHAIKVVVKEGTVVHDYFVTDIVEPGALKPIEIFNEGDNIRAVYTLYNGSSAPLIETLEALGILAVYDSVTGRLLSVYEVTLSADSMDVDVDEILIPYTDAVVKAFLWDAKSYAPLTEAVSSFTQ